jgi:hypothetical protein
VRARSTNLLARALAAVAALAAGCGGGRAAPAGHVIEIDLDDHGLAGLEMANAPNIKGLIARGTLAYSRVIVPTHSNQSNIALITGQYPDGDDVPANSWLARDASFLPPVSLPGLAVGDYARYDRNPLLVRGDSVYRAVERAGGKTAYVGQLPPFEAGASAVHLTFVGTDLGGVTLTPDLARMLLTNVLLYPKDVASSYVFDGPPAPGESLGRFTMSDAAAFVRATSAASPMPAYMFVWGFIALEGDPTSESGASGPDLVRVIEEYDAGLGDLLAALDEKGLTADTNILLTLDHGKVDTHQQVVLGTRGADATGGADGQLGALVAGEGPALGITTADYALLNEDGDAQIYARVPGAGTDAGAARQAEVTAALLSLVQSGAVAGLDPTRTMTADGALGTRRFGDFRGSSPHTADIVVFPQDDWTLNQVDATNTAPGPFQEHAGEPYGRHGGFSVDELYVPLIMAGPAFKSGVLIPHPIDHPQVPATALAALAPPVRLATAELPAITAALAGQPGETVAQPGTLAEARQLALEGSGFLGAPALAGPPAQAAVIVDLGGVYDEELFGDGALAAAAGPVRALAARGTRFQDFWTRSRDWPVSEFEMLVGSQPAGTRTAEDDPTQTLPPGLGLLQMPTASGFVADRAAFDAWRAPQPLADESLFDAAHAVGMTTALVGQPDFHVLHIPASAIDVSADATATDAAGAVADLLAQHPRLLVVVALGGSRTGPRSSAQARESLASLAAAVGALADAAPGALFVLTGRGATTIDDPDADAYGAGSSRHVPCVLVGPNVRADVVTSQPGALADIPATVLFGLGAPARTDFVDGTWAAGTPAGGIAQPSPRQATAGHALLRAYALLPAPAPTPLP